jgi:V8-like Glu-specific endopeptidase
MIGVEAMETVRGRQIGFSRRALMTVTAAIASVVVVGPALAQTDIFTQYQETGNPNTPRAIGKLFSNDGYCSASVISPNNIIVTAAHCCWDRTKNNWIGGWSFAPAYNNGNAPYGMFNWAQARVLNSWINNGDIASDVCLIALQNDAHGHGVTYYTGWLGRSWNYPSALSMHALGYPGNIGGGNTLQLCASESFAQSASCGSDVLNTGCSMTYGSSGGPWIRDYRTGNHVDSVVHGYVSQSCTGTFGKTFDGPRFTSNNIVTLCNAQGC